jgi:holo-ACP synthase CitX
MSYARLRAEILATRDAREAALDVVLRQTTATVIVASTVVPGPRKKPPGIDTLLRWGLARLEHRIDACRLLLSESDLLGPYAVFSTATEPRLAKHACIAVENSHPASRLLDLDVYAATATRIGRVQLGELPRSCLLCAQPATDCIRLNRHPMEALLEHVDYLLEAFGDSATR